MFNTLSTRLLKLAVVACCVLATSTSDADIFGTGLNQFDIEFVGIGNPGNPDDTTGVPNPAGSVDYTYRMGKFEISRSMIDKANIEGGLGLTLADTEALGIVGGNGPNRPATGVSWNEAARFVNWLNTSTGHAAAYKFEFQPGEAGYNSNAGILLWGLGDAGYNPNNLFRNSQAKYCLPSVDEWYKAAYYDPNANGGLGGYWNYPTGSDAAPTPVASGTAAGTAVYLQPAFQGPADITQAGGLSPYGTLGQGGNVWEWQESSETSGSANSPITARGIRGGNWLNESVTLFSSVFVGDSPSSENLSFGFRVASVPEPGSLLLGALAGVGMLVRKRR